MKSRIGVLGGVGPEATSYFYFSLIKKLQEKGIKSNTDLPQIIINSIPAPELLQYKHSKKVIDAYLKGLKELELHNPDFIIMVCNTIHFYYDYLQKSITVPIIDIRKEVKNKLHGRRHTVFGSRLTVKKLYKFENSINMNENDIKIINQAIFDFNRGLKPNINYLCEKYHNRGAEQILLGCTELPLILKKPYTISTLDIMVEATVNANKIKN